MPAFTITERVTFAIEADSAQEALDSWLNAGEKAPGYAFQEVSDREVHDANGRPCEVEEDF